MRFTALFALYTGLVFAEAQKCSDFKNVADLLEKDLQKKTLENCSNLEKFDNINEFHCQSLASIDLEISRLQNQEAILQGLQKIKIDLSDSAKQLAEDQELLHIQKTGKLLSLCSEIESMLTDTKFDPKKITSKNKVELELLLAQKKLSTKEDIQKWIETLKVNKTSYHELYEQFKKIDFNNLTSKDLNLITQLSVITENPDKIERFEKSKFKFQVQSLISRLTLDIKAKNSLLINDLKAGQDRCEDFEKLTSCLTPLTASNFESNADLNISLRDNLLVSLNYLERLSLCEKDQTQCNFIQQPLADMAEKLSDLLALKEKILKQEEGLARYRNKAFEQVALECTNEKEAISRVDFCETGAQGISPEIQYIKSTNFILLKNLYTEKSSEDLCSPNNSNLSSVKKLCELMSPPNADLKTGTAKDKKKEEAQKKAEQYIASSDVEGGSRKTKDAITNFLGNTLKDYVTAKNAMNLPRSSPFPYNYVPNSQPLITPMGISDSILTGATRVGGYGFYRPTPGVTPYTSFPQAPIFTGYRPLPSMASPYFSLR